MICKKNNKCKTFLKVIISSFLVFLLVVNIDWQEVWGYIANIEPIFIVVFLVLYLIGVIISARKWQTLAKFKKFQNAYLFYFKSYLLGTFLNNFFPSFIGGDTYRAYSLGKPVNRVSQSSTTIVADRISGLMGAMILAVVFAMINKGVLLEHEIIVMIVLMLSILIIVFCGIIIFFHAKLVKYFITFLPQFVQKYIKQLAQFRKKRIMSVTILYSFLFSFVGLACVNYVLFIAIGVELSFVDFLSVVFLSSIISSAPISVGNIGVKEWAYIFLFGIFGVSTSAAVTVVLLSRVLQMLVSLIAIPFYIQNKKSILQEKN